MALHSVQALCPSLDGEVKIGKRMAASFKRPIRVHKQQKRARGPALSWEQRSKLRFVAAQCMGAMNHRLSDLPPNRRRTTHHPSNRASGSV